jgi:hypothetical protein
MNLLLKAESYRNQKGMKSMNQAYELHSKMLPQLRLRATFSVNIVIILSLKV